MSIKTFSPVPLVTPNCSLTFSVDEERNEVFAQNGGTKDGLFDSQRKEAGRARSCKLSYHCFLFKFSTVSGLFLG